MSYALKEYVWIPGTTVRPRKAQVDLIDEDSRCVRVVNHRGKRAWYTMAQLDEANIAAAAQADAVPKAAVRSPVAKRDMTNEEKQLAHDLAGCSMGHFSKDKGFVRDMVALAKSENAQISDGQARFLRALQHKYRLQLGRAARAEST